MPGIVSGGVVFDAVLLGLVGVVDLDEADAFVVALVVDVLQFGQDRLRFGVSLLICERGQNETPWIVNVIPPTRTKKTDPSAAIKLPKA